MIDFYDVCHKLHLDVLRAVALGLGMYAAALVSETICSQVVDMDERYFDPLSDQAWHTLRLLNYPPVAKQLLAREGQARAGAHTGATAPDRMCGKSLNTMADYGSLTFVFQDDVSFTVSLIPYLNFVVQVGGLQVQNPHTQNYIPAIPIVSETSLADGAEFIQFM